MEYTEFSFVLSSLNHSSEFLVASLGELGFESFEEQESTLLAYIPTRNLLTGIDIALEKSTIRQWFISYSSRVIPEQNWNAVWESQYDPVTIGNRCKVRAPFHNKTKGIEFDIVIEPKMSFGTAHHETTRLMLEYLLDIEVTGKSLLDMGCGTGVLAILASLKGAAPVYAIDNDEWAYANSLENAAMNKCTSLLVLHGDASLLKGMSVEVILANINRNILLRDIQVYATCLVSGGLLLMSGFYLSDMAAIREECKNQGLVYRSHREHNAWTAVLFTKK